MDEDSGTEDDEVFSIRMTRIESATGSESKTTW